MNKTAIITGSSRGIGRAIAVKFARNGYNVVINSVNGGDKLDETEALCVDAFKSVHQAGQTSSVKEPSVLPGILKLQGDVSDPQFANRLISKAIERFGRVDVLVNNAGKRNLPDYLEEVVFAGNEGEEIAPTSDEVEGFNRYMKNYLKMLPAEAKAVECK